MISLLVSAIAPLLDKVIPDADERNRLAHEIATLTERQAHEIAKAQIEVNRTEAASPSIFVSGARPAAMWVCVSGMAFNFIILPLIMVGCDISGIAVDISPLDTSEMMPILMGLLGLGTMRSYEKKNGVARMT